MRINGVHIDKTFAEAFPIKATRIIITAHDMDWAYHAANAATGFATSIIACGCEADVERELKPSETPDGRPGVSVLMMSMSAKELAKQIQNRVGQCVLTAPTSACFSGMHEGEKIPLGKNLRYFGDGFQISKKVKNRRYWRIPVMDGEFICEESTHFIRAIGGGNFLVLAKNQLAALKACSKAVKAMRKIRNVIMPFPGGIVRSGSKVGSIYPNLRASTNDTFCPTIKGRVKTKLSPDINAVMEIVINGLDEQSIRNAIKIGIATICKTGAKQGISSISAGNYGGNLGPYHFHLQDILQ